MPDNSDIQIIVGREDVSPYVENPSFSCADPGGFEAASLEFTRNVRIPRGTDVKFLYRQSIAWEGRVNEVNRQMSAQPVTRLACQGYGARFKENGGAMIFVDQDLNQWRGPGTGRRASFATGGSDVEDAPFVADTSDGLPALAMGFLGAWTRAHWSEMWYDAGPGLTVAGFFYNLRPDSNVALTDPNWSAQFYSAIADGETGNSFVAQTADLIPGTGAFASNNIYQTLTAAQRYLMFQFGYTVAAGAAGVDHRLFTRNLTVYGPHGLTRRGTEPGGFYPEDIVKYAQKAAYPLAQITLGPVDAAGYIIPHLVYRTPVPWEQMIDDMAKLAGFHYGTWEGPALHFRSYPGTPTCWTNAAAVDDLQIDDSLDGLYNVIQVTWRDAGGATGVVTCTRNIAALSDAGITRTLYMDIGVGTATTATAFGNIVLAISERNASSTGSFVTKTPLMASGGDKPAFMLRPGIDRLKVTDLTADGDGQTEFIVKRIEATIASDGISTSVELGRGADLIEALQARLQQGIVPLGIG